MTLQNLVSTVVNVHQTFQSKALHSVFECPVTE